MQYFGKFLGTVTEKLNELTGGHGPLLLMRMGQLIANSEIMTRAGTVRDESKVVARHLREALVELGLVDQADVGQLGIFQMLNALFGRWLELAGVRPVQDSGEDEIGDLADNLEEELNRHPRGPFTPGGDDDEPVEGSFRVLD